MAAPRARAVLLGLVLALCATLSPAAASLPDSHGIAGGGPADDHVLDLLQETARAEQAHDLAESSDAPPFTLWPGPPPPAGQLFARTPEPPLLKPAVPDSRIALGNAGSLAETRVRAFGPFEPHLRLARSRVSRETATGYTLGLRETYVGPTQKGLWTDPVTGMAYARARWYDPRNAGWLSEDPLLDIDSPNLYAFVGWQPTMATDPMGEESLGEAIERYAVDAYASGKWWQKGLAFLGQTFHATVQMASAGAVGKIDAAQESLDRGEIERGEYWKRSAAGVGQAAASYAVGGAAGAAGGRFAGAALGARAATTAGRATVGAAAGSAGGVGGLAASDAVGVAAGTPEEFSSATEYLSAAAVGAAAGTVTGAATGPRFKTARMNEYYAGEDVGRRFGGRRVPYFNSGQRQAYRMRVKDGRLYDAEGNLFDTGDDIALYVMDERGGIFAARTTVDDNLHHSSFLGGEPVAGAGIMQVHQGRITVINDRSGHYHPSPELFEQVLRRLSEQGVKLP